MTFLLGSVIAGLVYLGLGWWAISAFKEYVDEIVAREGGVTTSPQSFKDNISYQIFAQRVYLQRFRRPESEAALETLRLRARRRSGWLWFAFFTIPIFLIVLDLFFGR